MNVVCYERVCYEWVCYEWVCYERGLLWAWSVLSGLLWMVCFERVCFERTPNLKTSLEIYCRWSTYFHVRF